MTRRSTKGIPRPQARGPRPQVWVTGPDLVTHKKYRVFIQQRNQANYRGEGWHISFEDWCALWQDKWESRGRERGDYCMTRLDWSLPWTVANTQIVNREEHARQQAMARISGWRSIARKRKLTQEAQV